MMEWNQDEACFIHEKEDREQEPGSLQTLEHSSLEQDPLPSPHVSTLTLHPKSSQSTTPVLFSIPDASLVSKPTISQVSIRPCASTPFCYRVELESDNDITPMPDYRNMGTPYLKVSSICFTVNSFTPSLSPQLPSLVFLHLLTLFQDECSKFGVRAMPKKKMIVKLEEIYDYTHPLVGKLVNNLIGCALIRVLCKLLPARSIFFPQQIRMVISYQCLNLLSP